MGVRTEIQVGTNGGWSLTSWAELGESGSVAPCNGSAGRTKLNTGQGRHIITQNSLGELDRVRDEGGRLLPLGVETLSKVLQSNIPRMSTRLDEDA
jgi:hypothetical protein